MRAPGKKREQRIASPTISARLSAHITLEPHADGIIAACFNGHSVGLGKFSAGVADSAQQLRKGLPLSSFVSSSPADVKEIRLLVERLARSGLLEYRLGREDGDLVVIEPQIPDYWPRTPKLGNSDSLVLSRFAYLRRRGNEMVLESPRAGALFRICDPKIATALVALSVPQKISRLRRQAGFPGLDLLALLLDCRILFKIDAADGDALRPAEGDDDLVLWDFHDLLFHTRSTEGRQANPLGGLYPYAGLIPPPPAVRPSWPGAKIDLRKLSAAPSESHLAFHHGLCTNVIRRAISTTSNRSRLSSSRGFWTAPRASARNGKPASILATTVRKSNTPPGRILREVARSSSSSIWPSPIARDWHADSITTMPTGTRWFRSLSARKIWTRCC